MKILVAHGSVRGGTAEIARAIGDELATAGHEVDVHDAGEIDGLAAWDAVIIGGALYASFWPRGARRFVRQHADELALMPVWMFSSGPLDDSAAKGRIPPTQSVTRYMRSIGARGHETFGGRLAADAKGFPASAMAKRGLAGDFRNMDAARVWARAIATELARLPTPTARPPARSTRGARRVVAVLCLFTGVTALGGGIELAVWPDGPPWSPWLDPSILRGTPFHDFFVPGILLVSLVGLPNLVASLLTARRPRVGEQAAVVAGAAITTWIATELALLHFSHGLHALFLSVGTATVVLASWAAAVRRATLRARRTPARVTPEPSHA